MGNQSKNQTADCTCFYDGAEIIHNVVLSVTGLSALSSLFPLSVSPYTYLGQRRLVPSYYAYTVYFFAASVDIPTLIFVNSGFVVSLTGIGGGPSINTLSLPCSVSNLNVQFHSSCHIFSYRKQTSNFVETTARYSFDYKLILKEEGSQSTEILHLIQ